MAQIFGHSAKVTNIDWSFTQSQTLLTASQDGFIKVCLPNIFLHESSPDTIDSHYRVMFFCLSSADLVRQHSSVCSAQHSVWPTCLEGKVHGRSNVTMNMPYLIVFLLNFVAFIFTSHFNSPLEMLHSQLLSVVKPLCVSLNLRPMERRLKFTHL
jgi:hypothetical protein